MTLKKITPQELYEKLQTQEGLTILDVRDEEKYNHFHLEGERVQSLNIHKTEIFKLEEDEAGNISALPKHEEIIVTCTTGNSATKCGNILARKDYNVAVLEGGLTAWKEFVKSKQ